MPRCDAADSDFEFGSSFYHVIDDNLTLEQAAIACAGLDQQLAVIETGEESIAIAIYLDENEIIGDDCHDFGSSPCSWIGLRQMSPSNEPTENWNWVDGTPHDPETAIFGWGNNEPNDDNDSENGEEDCVQLRANRFDWNDADCENLMPAVCECEN